MARIGFIGIGTMGLPMARNCLNGGHQLRAFDINPAAVEAIAADGADVAISPADCARGQDIVITMVPNGEHVEAALFNGNAGAASTMDNGTLYIDMSTILPEVTDRIHARMTSLGISMIEAPVGRPQEAALTGNLLIMVGGDEDLIARARPVLSCMGSEIVRCGGPGAGSRMKIINNYMSIVLNALTAEALTMAERIGLDLATARDVMSGTAASKGHMHTTYPSKVLAGDKTPGFMIDLAMKDLGLGLQMAAMAAMASPIGMAAKTYYETAQDQGRGRDDWTTLYEATRIAAGLPAKF